MLDSFAFDFYHLLEVIALDNELRNGLFVVSLVDSTDLYQHIQSLVLKKRKGILIFHFLDLLFDLSNPSFLLLDLFLVLELTLVVVLDDLQFLQSLGQDLVFI